ncbi:MAG: hypothetical protein MJ249_01155 [Kiritimatiellae bacterium]|nr:hypothetical protein [Kiritimatiellia bacterium]
MYFVVFKPSGHTTCVTNELAYGHFDRNDNKLPNWWEAETLLSVDGRSVKEYEDTDGDGLINGFIATGSFTSDGLDRFGWYHLSVDDNMQMSILDVGIGFYGEAVVVGIGPIPEPSCVLLALLGGALLVLWRKNLCCLR